MVTAQRAFRAKYAKAFVSPLPCDLADLTAWIIAAVKNIDALMLTRVWPELEYRIDVCRVTRGAHFERLYFNPLNAKLNPICHLLALLGAHHILHISRIRVKKLFFSVFLWL